MSVSANSRLSVVAESMPKIMRSSVELLAPICRVMVEIESIRVLGIDSDDLTQPSILKVENTRKLVNDNTSY